MTNSKGKMAPLIVLIDPDDNEPAKFIDEIIRYHKSCNSHHLYEVWVGCSNSPGSKARKTVEDLATAGVPCSVYPGNPEQVKETLRSAAHYFLPDPLIHNNPQLIEKMKKTTLNYLKGTPVSKYTIMTYILLNPFCSTAKVFKLDHCELNHEIFSDDEVLQRLLIKKQQGQLPSGTIVYLEGGSRVKEGGIVTRIDLVEKIKKRYPELHILGAGGIAGAGDLITLLQTKKFDTILVSGSLHQNPFALSGFIEIVRKYFFE